MGLLDPATSDGRVIFFLPWEKMTIAGTTDSPTNVTAHPIPGEDDINFILREVRNYLSPDVEGIGLCLYCFYGSDYLNSIQLCLIFSAEGRRAGSLERHPPPGYRSQLQGHPVNLQEPHSIHQ